MSSTPSSLFDLLQSHSSPAEHARLHWEGSFQQYLALVEDDPYLARNAWQRLLDMVEGHGFGDSVERGVSRRWNIFDDPFDRGRALRLAASTVNQKPAAIKSGRANR